jgi:4-amino-4-deoxy-L-arabinose transferase-like glycosyltransferase
VRQLDAPRQFALTAAMVLAFNPLYFSLSYTFMTDVPFTALSVWAMLFLLRSLLYEAEMDLILGSCLAVGAILYRQVGIFIPLAFALAVLVRHRWDVKWLLRGGCMVVVGIALLIGMKAFVNLTAPYNQRWEDSLILLQNPVLVLELILQNAYVAVMYVGLFLFPVAVKLVRVDQGAKLWPTSLFLLFSATLSAPLIYSGSLMPISRNVRGSILTESGLGPVLLRDTYILFLPHLPVLPQWFFAVTTLMSIIGGAMLLTWLALAFVNLFSNRTRVLTLAGEEDHSVASLFFFSAAVICLLPMALQIPFFDRYVVPLLPLACAAVAPLARPSAVSCGRLVSVVAMLSLAGMLVLSVGGARDYLAWNRARWAALDELTAKQSIPPTQIDGGFEFNGWHLYDHNYQLTESKSHYWVHEDAYVVAMGEIEGYDTVQRHSFTLWIPPHEGNVLVLRRRDRP